jgi:hypothetical protein
MPAATPDINLLLIAMLLSFSFFFILCYVFLILNKQVKLLHWTKNKTPLGS